MFESYEDDRVGSDDLDAILELSREEYEPRTYAEPGPSRIADEPSYLRKQTLNGRLTSIEIEIDEIDQKIRDFGVVRSDLVRQKKDIEQQLAQVLPNRNGMNSTMDRKGKGRATQSGIDYTVEFDWSPQLKARMKQVFGIDNFRLCQQGVCNANMDGRDIVCVMPTGGGKSLTYQLPALLTPGCTLVVSPLISLITDQILHLREAGVEAVMLTGGTPFSEIQSINSRLIVMASSSGAAPARGPDIKLCYVTPEKIAKNKHFISMLEKLATAGKLARIVIDEAHCVSEMGHDYRPDYKKLSKLRKLFPRVPILALSATCPEKVLQDILGILGMKQTVHGNAAAKDGTVYFSAPLYRKNLHYTIVPKPSSKSQVLELMSDYILKNHKDDSGIIYCLSKKETEDVAKELMKYSRGQIKTGVYHAGVSDSHKEALHVQWRKGVIKVVCATIAFGLGIDKGNVRFVLHHSLSKTLDGFYQESGRAGRDGKDADCILYYRPQDATRLSAMTCEEQKLHPILRFAQDLRECRKIQFAKHFSVSSDLSLASWTTDDMDALERCGHCDNCTRPLGDVDQKDVTVEAWQILKIVDSVKRQGGRLTHNGLGDLARGMGGGAFDVGSGKGKGKTKEKQTLNLDEIAGGKVGLSRDETQTLLVDLHLEGYLKHSYVPTSHSVNVYVDAQPQALRLTRFSLQDLQNNKGPRILCHFRKAIRKSKSKGSNDKQTSKKVPPDNEESDIEVSSRPTNGQKAATTVPRKRKRKEATPEIDDDGDGDLSDFIVDDDLEDFSNDIRQVDAEESEPEEDDWTFSAMRVPASKKPRKHGLPSTSTREPEIVEISD